MIIPSLGIQHDHNEKNELPLYYGNKNESQQYEDPQ